MTESSYGVPNFPVSGGSLSHDSFNTNSTERYGNLLHQSFTKKIRGDLIQLFNYIYSVSPRFTLVHKIVQVIRVLQFLGPSLLVSYLNYWEFNTVQQLTVDIFSFFFLIIPPSVKETVGFGFLYIFIILKVLLIIVLYFSSIYFKKNAKLPNFVIQYIALDFATLGYFLHPIAFYQSFDYLSDIVFGSFNRSLIEFIILFVLVILMTILHCVIVFDITSKTMIFRPASLMSLTSAPSNQIFLITIFLHMFIGFGSCTNQIMTIVILSFTFLFYVSSIVSIFYQGGFVYLSTSVVILSSSVTSALFSILTLICFALKRKGELIYVFGFMVVFVLLTFVFYLILRGYRMRLLAVLDSYPEEMSKFIEIVRSKNYFLNLCLVGFIYAHPICVDLKIFEFAIERWKSDPVINFAFAKFNAIYLEETNRLIWIYFNVSLNKLNGPTIRCIKEQTLGIIRSRETNLTNQLKAKLNRLSSHNDTIKHKILHVWDVVIQGNIGDIESSTKRAIKEIEQTDADYKHLVRQFPNNRFALKEYASFLSNIKADFRFVFEMNEKKRRLRLGNVIIKDQAHEYGLSTFKLLPDNMKGSLSNINTMSDSGVNQSSFQDSTDFHDNDDLNEIDQLSNLRNRIEELTIPAVRCTEITRILFLFFFFFIPCIGGLIYLEIFIEDLKSPLGFLSAISLIRSYLYQIVTFSMRAMGEKLNVFPILPNITKKPPKQFGSSWDSVEQLRYIVQAAADSVQEFSSFQAFKQGNDNIQKAKDLVFNNALSYYYCVSPDSCSSDNLSIQTALMDFIVQQCSFLKTIEESNETFNASIINTSIFLNTANNIYNLTETTILALKYMTDFINEIYDKNKKISFICLICVITFELLVFLISLVIEIIIINSNKKETYQSLFSLPKNTVSKLSEKFKVYRKAKFSDRIIQGRSSLTNINGNTNKSFGNENSSLFNNDNNQEMNNQEQNTLKIFNSISYSDSYLSDIFILTFGTIWIIACAIGCIVVFFLIVNGANTTLKESAPHINYFLGSYSMMMGAMNNLQQLLLKFSPYPIQSQNETFLLDLVKQKLNQSREYFHYSSYGNLTFNQPSLASFENDVLNSNYLTDYCYNIETAPITIQDSFSCYPVDLAFALLEPIILYTLLPYEKKITRSLIYNNSIYSLVWNELISPLYNDFFYPVHITIIPTITDNLNSGKKGKIGAIIAMVVVAFIIEMCMFFKLYLIERHIRSVLCLFLHCRSEDIMANIKIMKLLSGDFSTLRSDTINRDEEFCDFVFEKHPDAIIYANFSDMIVQNRNESFQRIFGESVYNDIIGKSIKKFFLSEKFTGDITPLFNAINANQVKSISYKDDTKGTIYLEASSMLSNGIFIMICKDATEANNYTLLINEEKKKFDNLLSKILPKALANQVSKFERSISFTVQNVTILFADIVNFNNLCRTLPPNRVLAILSNLFSRFDQLLTKRPTLTKIKNIGDCYMVVGGIFNDAPQQIDHAKETVSYGLDLIRATWDFKKEQNQNIDIKIGVHTGGPIVAGILDISRPTFEVFGQDVGAALFLKKKGLPMFVHLSRPCYELLFKSISAEFRENGKHTYKDTTFLTYIATVKFKK